jgi:imidazolonepropionase-like amidohydrolase
VFEEARRAGLPVSVHCHGGLAADWCIEHRVDSLEHGFFLERRQLREMAERGLTLVTTCGVSLLQEANPSPAHVQEHVRGSLKIARSEGVRCVPGTDGVHGRLDFEIAMLVESGWPANEALAAATGMAARLLGIEADHGTIARNKVADLVAVRGDPAADLSCLTEVEMVFQDGRPVFDRRVRDRFQAASRA